MSSVTRAAADADAVDLAVVGTAGGTMPKRNFGLIAERAWIWSVVGYSLLRLVVAWGAFGEHGVNVWVFGIIDVGTAWPYAKSVALVCRRVANSQWNQLPMPLTIAIACFFAPYAYIWFAAGEMPDGLRVAMALFVGVLFLAATGGVIAKSRKLRRAAGESVTEIDVSQSATAIAKPALAEDDGLLIDLTSEGETGELIIDLTTGATKLDNEVLRR